MKTENKLMIILFLMAFSTLFLLYAVISADNESMMSAGNSVVPTNADIGKTVYTEGKVLSKRNTFTGDHLIIQIECSDKTVLPIFIPKSTGASSIHSKVNVDDSIGVLGLVEEYDGALELVLKNEKDLIVLN
ncbi:hypothetical protein MmiEs2_04760 [Methanimicrococcus stummii]|uniref:Uncharacterized protein n=1 Tax=Methanimicrococcus stummii TaxID=3028294 RepID=A0AA96VL52_9EURY|nr:hypothetical protein [Methanimicrococcus sp. Es2]WNY28292.1 hypothetical protein MmiEs2_04760 [Methanimicrococcus sp. Es2]